MLKTGKKAIEGTLKFTFTFLKCINYDYPGLTTEGNFGGFHPKAYLKTAGSHARYSAGRFCR